MAVSITAFVNCKLFSTILSEKNNWNPSKGVLTYFAAVLGFGFFLKYLQQSYFSEISFYYSLPSYIVSVLGFTILVWLTFRINIIIFIWMSKFLLMLYFVKSSSSSALPSSASHISYLWIFSLLSLTLSPQNALLSPLASTNWFPKNSLSSSSDWLKNYFNQKLLLITCWYKFSFRFWHQHLLYFLYFFHRNENAIL